MDAAGIINGARDAHPALDKKSTPDHVALRWLAKYQQGLLTEIAQWKPDALHVDQEIDLPLVDFDAGEALDEYLVLHGGTITFVDTQRKPEPLVLVDYLLRLDQPPPLAAYVRAGTLFLLGTAEDWTDVSTVTLDLFPAGPDALELTEELLLPGTPRRACEAALATFMATRAEVANKVPDPAGAVDSYLDEITGRRRAKVGRIREVF